MEFSALLSPDESKRLSGSSIGDMNGNLGCSGGLEPETLVSTVSFMVVIWTYLIHAIRQFILYDVRVSEARAPSERRYGTE